MNGEDNQAPDTLIDLLNQLAEPERPAPVSMLPQTAGWLVLAILILVLIAYLVFRIWRRWRAAAYRRAALDELVQAGDDPVAVADVLRRTALAAWPRSKVAGLTGGDWLAFLDATGDGRFSYGPGRAIVHAPYGRGARPVPGLGEAAKRWVRGHKVEDAT
ncbi:DUF4381 domain-containing protein [Amaricoccus tamworthensis]|uniref:DUF4381 domain-containing protein n=1 Tax=Amaricoccus tamworthensis TaxID=57002 RepID=UPI003C7C382B